MKLTVYETFTIQSLNFKRLKQESHLKEDDSKLEDKKVNGRISSSDSLIGYMDDRHDRPIR